MQLDNKIRIFLNKVGLELVITINHRINKREKIIRENKGMIRLELKDESYLC